MFRLFPFQLRKFIAVAGAIVALLTPTAALSAEWRLEKMSGDVRVSGPDRKWVAAKPKQILKPGESVWTGRRSRAQIATDEGTVILSSRSLVKVPAQALPEGTTVLLHGQGQIRAKAQKRKERHFSIQTPFLAAVVKGTEFSVKAGSATTGIKVHEGQVGAVSVKSGETVDVKAGQNLSTSNARSGSLGTPSSAGGASSGGSSTGDNDPVDGNGNSFGGLASVRGSGGGGGHGHGHGHGGHH